MAIEPKIHIGYANEGRYSANKKFTDRIVYKDIFWNEINSIKSERSKKYISISYSEFLWNRRNWKK